MYQLTTHASFDSAHFLSGYEGKYEELIYCKWLFTILFILWFLCK